MIENPFNLTIAKLSNVKGMLNKNLPPTASIKAKITAPIKIIFLKFFDIFLDDVFANSFSKK
tara:strand:- start:314 stop:499 length:186 start_codon:yes stop_codon:yes gene_type:complete